jgi:porin
VAAATSAALAGFALAQEPEVSTAGAASGSGLWSRSRLTGDWGGARTALAEHGVSVELDATYTFQGVASGGLDGPLFERFSDEDDTGHIVSGVLQLGLDTEGAGLWRGGSFTLRLDGRAGRSVLQRAGSVSAVDNDALFPNVVDRFDDEALAITELTFMQYVGERVALFGGLLDTAEGDENALAGSALSNSHFLNSAMLYSLVEDATVPNASLGGGVLVEPSDDVSGSLSAFGTEETAGEDPFARTEGATFSTEWTLEYSLWERPGAQTVGFLYGIDASRTAIAADPRLVVGGLLSGRQIPTTTDDTWAAYYNAHQYLEGDADRGWGLFARFGVSDGNPTPVHWNGAGGAGGKGLLPRRGEDTWGVGGFYLGLSDQDLLKGLGVDDELGGELFYNVAVTPWLRVTLDAQVIDPALPRADTTWVLGVRTHVDL